VTRCASRRAPRTRRVTSSELSKNTRANDQCEQATTEDLLKSPVLVVSGNSKTPCQRGSPREPTKLSRQAHDPVRDALAVTMWRRGGVPSSVVFFCATNGTSNSRIKRLRWLIRCGVRPQAPVRPVRRSARTIGIYVCRRHVCENASVFSPRI